MKINIHNLKGDVIEKMDADDKIFKVELKNSVIRQAVLSERTNLRQGTHSSKNRSAVRGGGKKPWKQKGRGVARAGTIRSPIWRGGGTVFGPQPHDYKTKISKKMKRLARRSVLSFRADNGDILVVDEISISSPKTKEFIEFLKILNISGKKVTILVASLSENLFLSSRNVPNIYLVEATSASTYDLLDCEKLLFDKAGLALLNKKLMVSN